MLPAATLATLATLVAALCAAAPLAGLSERLQGHLAVPGARLEVVGVNRSNWPAGAALSDVEVPNSIRASGRVAARLSGKGPDGAPCMAWVWVQVRVLSTVHVTERDLQEGEPLSSASHTEEREILPGRSPLGAIPSGAVAARRLAAGQVLEPHHVRGAGPSLGKPIAVLARSGAISVVQEGRTVPCSGGQVCAQLPTGKRVAGRYEGGQLVVEIP
ncbi:MAG: hypothetical protein QM765_39430 [Myxococcales bacterium]